MGSPSPANRLAVALLSGDGLVRLYLCQSDGRCSSSPAYQFQGALEIELPVNITAFDACAVGSSWSFFLLIVCGEAVAKVFELSIDATGCAVSQFLYDVPGLDGSWHVRALS